MKTAIHLLLVCISFYCLSCKKESTAPPPTPAIYGNWKYVSLRSEVQRNEYYTGGVDSYTTVYRTTRTATELSGGIEITPGSLTQKAIKSTTMDSNFIYNYANDIPQDTAASNGTNNLPQMDSKLFYSLVGQDSLTFTIQNVFGSFVPDYPSTLGAKYSVNGNILTIFSSSFGTAGSMSTSPQTKYAVMTFQRE